MKVLLVGGGSGGHITPLLAVADELQKAEANLDIRVVSERRGKFFDLFAHSKSIQKVYKISAGKFRRYHGESWLERFTDFRTIGLNLRDAVLSLAGIIESIFLLVRWRPDVVFIKGGYVGVPVGLSAFVLRIPYVTHDSDASAGLSNRLIGGHAQKNLVGMPPEFYNYDPDKIMYVGVPVREGFKTNEKAHLSARKKLDIGESEQLLLCLGGSNGAQAIDEIMHEIYPSLFKNNKNLKIIHQYGKGNAAIFNDYPKDIRSKINPESFLEPLADYVLAADVVVTRAGATAIAELASAKKPIIVIPAAHLSAGHQVQNAKILNQAEAAIVIKEEKGRAEPKLVQKTIENLLDSKELRQKLKNNLYKLIPADAVVKICQTLIEIIKK